jgi:hypothetical protein
MMSMDESKALCRCGIDIIWTNRSILLGGLTIFMYNLSTYFIGKFWRAGQLCSKKLVQLDPRWLPCDSVMLYYTTRSPELDQKPQMELSVVT